MFYETLIRRDDMGSMNRFVEMVMFFNIFLIIIKCLVFFQAFKSWKKIQKINLMKNKLELIFKSIFSGKCFFSIQNPFKFLSASIIISIFSRSTSHHEDLLLYYDSFYQASWTGLCALQLAHNC